MSVALGGQHRSLEPRAGTGIFGPHSKLHEDASPIDVSTVQGSPSSHEVSQDPGGSQVSPSSTTPFPHLAVQSPSLFALPLDGQQPSPFFGATTGS